MGKILFEKFKGLWARNPVESCPPDHFTDCMNLGFNSGGIITRFGTSLLANLPTNITRMELYKTDNKTDTSSPTYGNNVTRPIFILANGNLVDYFRWGGLTAGVVGPGYSLATDISAISMFNRFLFSPVQNGVAYPGSNVFIYNGILTGQADSIYDYAGALNSNSAVVTVTGGPDASYNKNYAVAIAYEKKTGFIIPPSNWANTGARPDMDLFGPGGYSWSHASSLGISLPDITGTIYAARHILISKGSSTSDLGSPPNFSDLKVELFMSIRDTNMAAHTVYPDARSRSLVNSATYILNQMLPIPAGASVGEYNGRLIVFGPYTDKNLILVSKAGEPESISKISGFRIIDATDPTGVKTGVEFRGNLYVFTGRRTAVLADNGGEVSTWDLEILDKAIGTPSPRGVAKLFDSKGSSSYGFLVASEKGIHLFNGVYQEPELTYKVEDLWKRINKTYLYKIELYNDPISEIIYALVPLDNSADINYILMGDYKEGLTTESVKWSPWQIGNSAPQAGMIIYDGPGASAGNFIQSPSGYTTLFGHTTKVLKMDSALSQDDGLNISSYAHIPPARFNDGISHFNRLRLRALGSGSINITPWSQDLELSGNTISHQLAANPGREYAYLMNHVNEECRLVVVSFGNTKFDIRRIQIEGDALWDERPR